MEGRLSNLIRTCASAGAAPVDSSIPSTTPSDDTIMQLVNADPLSSRHRAGPQEHGRGARKHCTLINVQLSGKEPTKVRAGSARFGELFDPPRRHVHVLGCGQIEEQ